MLTGLLDVLKGIVEFLGIDAGLLVNLAGFGESSPAAFCVGRRIVVGGSKRREGQ